MGFHIVSDSVQHFIWHKCHCKGKKLLGYNLKSRHILCLCIHVFKTESFRVLNLVSFSFIWQICRESFSGFVDYFKVVFCTVFIAQIDYCYIAISNDCHLKWLKTKKWQCQLLRLKYRQNVSKHKKDCPTLFIWWLQMHLYTTFYFHFHAADLLKQYLKWNWAHL